MSLREELEAVAEAKGLVISPHHEHKIELMEEDGRVCRCDTSRGCPCDHIDQDVEEWGSCLCRVLVTPERLEKQTAYYNNKPHAKAKKPRQSIPVDL